MNPEGGTSTAEKNDDRLKQTMKDLDAILGIEEETEETEDTRQSTAVTSTSDPARKEAAGPLTAEASASKISDPRVISDQLQKVLEKAKQIGMEQGNNEGNAEGQQQVRQEFEQLLNIVFSPDNGISKEDVRKLRESGVFGPMSFWVTEIKDLKEESRVGVVVRGNLRQDREKVFVDVCRKVDDLFQDKYKVLMVEDQDAYQDTMDVGPSSSSSQEPRVAFQIVPSAVMQPPQTNGWKVLVAGVLLVLLLASCVQLSLVANISKLPKETLEYLSKPENLNSDTLPPGLDTWDPMPYLTSAVPICFSVLGINLTHEVGHRIAAFVRGVRLGPSFFIPNLQVGSFGAITPINSLLKNRRELWDVAFAGPLAGGLASAALLAVGLAASTSGDMPKELLVPVPAQLFQGSLLLGTITKLALGDAALRGSEVLISPLTIAGWCGLITTALNLLPVGSLDGGRMMQAAYGLQAHSLSSFFTYVGLGLGLLGSSLSLPFGLYVLICQRSAERYIQDTVSPVEDGKGIITLVAVLTAVLVLVPMAPELAESVGVGADNVNLMQPFF